MARGVIDDLTGRRFGKLTVISAADLNAKTRDKTKWYWRCLCDCGETTDVRMHLLLKGRTKSCGCLKGNHKDLSPVESGFHRIFMTLKKSARRRNLPVEISEADFTHLATKNCYYCGNSPLNCQRLRLKHSSVLMWNGLDRVENSKGYVLDNVVPCCIWCNQAKSSQTVTEFIGQAHRIAERFPKSIQFSMPED